MTQTLKSLIKLNRSPRGGEAMVFVRNTWTHPQPEQEIRRRND